MTYSLKKEKRTNKIRIIINIIDATSHNEV